MVWREHSGKMKKLLTILLLCGIGTALVGEVYLEGPKIGPRAKGSGVPDRPFRELVDQRELMTEPVICNGFRTEMRVSLIRRPMAELLRELRTRYPDLGIKLRRGGALLAIKLGGRWCERVLLVGTGDRVTVFAMRLPDPPPKVPAWPTELVLPDGAEPDEVVAFPARGSVYGSFSGADPGALNRAAAALAAQGYMPVTREAHETTGRGELFLNAAKQRIVTLSIASDGTGTIMLSPLDRSAK